MSDPVEQYRKQQLYRRIYEKRLEAFAACRVRLCRDNALREEIERNMKYFVATSLQCRYRGWKGRCIAARKRRRHTAAIAIGRIIRGFLGRRRAAEEKRKLRQVLHSPIALKLLLERSTVVRTIKNWQELLDPHTNEYFYFHIFTHDSQWLPPESYQEFLVCKWPECNFVAKTVHEIHEHYRTMHIWYCPVCMVKVCTSTFPTCPMCKSICSHDPVTGEILGPGETQLQIMQQAKEAQDELRRQKEEAYQHRMQYWATLAGQQENSHGQSPKKKRALGFERLNGSTSSLMSSTSAPAPTSEDPDVVALAHLKDIDPSVMDIEWLSSWHRRAKQDHLFAKALLRFGSLYVGDFNAENKSFDGLGELIYANGARYVGDWVDGTKHGVGILTFSSGERYVGHFENGKFNGTGVFFAANGDRYEGKFQDNRPNGFGKFKKVTGDRYIGNTVDGRACGVGTVSTADGEVYKGHWDKDFRHGSGVCFYPNGAVYSGGWWRGRWSGNGIYVSSEGIKYVGEFSKGKQHGKGKLFFDNGDVFDGHFVHGVAEGSGKTKGIYRFCNSGNLYIGDWVANKRHGNGTYTFVGGSSYTGTFINDHVQGRGTVKYSNGNVYKGDFVNAEKHGEGIYRWRDGSVLEGHFEHGVIQGFGKIVYATGHTYEGQWQDNKKYGKGKFTYRNGDVYDGEWRADRRHGYGVFTWNPNTPQQEIYEGMLDDERRHGRGKYHYANGTVYDGDWEYGKREGSGTFTWPNGDVYSGHFVDEMQHGFGSFFSASTGDTYEGAWARNVREGHGKIIYASGKVFEGTFHQGRRHGTGIMTYSNGNSYHGVWNRDLKQGGGRYVLRVTSEDGDNAGKQKESLHVRVFGY
ncbi:phosphatidylinositol-4-phosphate 5-kinase-like protein 1 [Phytophthora pseudosyringae]|uniref:Phosphatidylinositol-4-phosphate 5-kinase-like protein 1 n=1 Tax=Phytophthora pseudosyringae TaxID=221518 RepID=A0A8T1W0H0_9STRA|nr:phosphatidylinositol-4-phosphate 5-kinase-like protein 1 [Phytophthora pseudosyringae]